MASLHDEQQEIVSCPLQISEGRISEIEYLVRGYSKVEERTGDLDRRIEAINSEQALVDSIFGKENRCVPMPNLNKYEAPWIENDLSANQISAIGDIAESVFGDKTTANDWLREPNLATDERPPIQLLGTSEGFERVKNLLMRIQYGVLA
jgi:hypothetical protein